VFVSSPRAHDVGAPAQTARASDSGGGGPKAAGAARRGPYGGIVLAVMLELIPSDELGEGHLLWTYHPERGPETAYYRFRYGLEGESLLVSVPVTFLAEQRSHGDRRRVIETEIGRMRAELLRRQARRRG
jgi:hypothetical protein